MVASAEKEVDVDGRRAREVTLAPETLPRLRRHDPDGFLNPARAR